MIYSGGQPGSSAMPADYQPLYRVVADDLRTKMSDGTYPPGSPLPTKRELCDEYEVSKQTIETAMVVLREGGWVTRRGARVLVANPLPTSGE
jgi:DNA-binding GntR family transcriptional regulator